MSTLLAPAEALRLVLARVRALPAEQVPISDGLGRVLAQDVASADDVPGFDNSAMDGYALRAEDTTGAGEEAPVEFLVVGESRAGQPSELTLAAGQAIAISTGAMVPAGADAVVRRESASVRPGGVSVLAGVAPGENIRRAAEDIRAGETVLESGSRLGPAELGVIASVGAGDVSCARRPRVAVVTTGDELVGPGTPLRPGQIRNTNAHSTAGQVRVAGAALASIGHAADDYDATVAALRTALEADVLVACGGVSVGEHDHVKAALASLDVEEVFWGVALRPGHPTWFGVRDSTLVFGLPGNPVSAMVTFHLFVRPALEALQGATVSRHTTSGVMDSDYSKRPGRAHVVRCRLETRDDGLHVHPTKEQGSHVLTSMLGAQAFALLEVERGDVKRGERVEIEILPDYERGYP